MIRILNELHVDFDGVTPGLTLWLVAYGEAEATELSRRQAFVRALAQFCGLQGWELEIGDDPYREQSLEVFAQGFASPDSGLKGWDPEVWTEGGEDG